MYEIEKSLIEIINSLERVTIITINQIDKLDVKSELTLKDIIIRNFIGKSFSLLNSIKILLSHGQEKEAIALMRLLIERVFYLSYLNETNTYQEFEDWSFIKYFEQRNKIRSSSIPKKKYEEILLKEPNSNIERYQKLKKEKNLWKEPKIENLAKKYRVSYIYSLGYDVASSSVHVRSHEGLYDCLRLTKKEIISPERLRPIITNAIFCSYLIFKIASNEKNYKWGVYYNEYLELIYGFLLKENGIENLNDLELKMITNLGND